MDVLVVLPNEWTINKIRYTQVPTGGTAFAIDMAEIDTPLDSEESLYNYPSFVLKKNGPTGFPAIEGYIRVETD